LHNLADPKTETAPSPRCLGLWINRDPEDQRTPDTMSTTTNVDPPPLTTAKSIVAKLGFTLTKREREYRLAPKAGTPAEREAQSYYGDDLDDMIATARASAAALRRPAPVLPTININGTARVELIAGYLEAMLSLQRAHEALGKIMPHGRDYISTDILMMAISQHRVRMDQVQNVITGLGDIAEAIR
jgi:hypothetical protein